MGTIRKIFTKIVTPKINYQPLIEVRVFKDALLFNLYSFQQKYPKLLFAPVLKSNAYGHGLVEVAGILDEANTTLSVPRMHSGHLPQRGRGGPKIPFFIVDSFYEALTLRQHGIKTKILVLGYCREKELLSAKLKDVSFGIIDLQILKNLSIKLKKPLNIHLKIDTGMHRQGILQSEVSESMAAIKSNPNINLEGLCTHFADADGADNKFTLGQIEKWNSAAVTFKNEFPNTKFFHASNTAAAGYAEHINANVSIISSTKNIPAGEKVGYGVTFESSKPMIVATVPVGYNEGVDRRLSNKGAFKVNGVFCPIVGRVSMNMSSIDVTDVTDVKIEDFVVVISSNKTDKNSVENLAKLCECIPYEILVHIPQHLRRRVV